MHTFNRKMFLTSISALGLFFGMLGSAQATVMIYTDRTSFEAAISGAVTEDFSDTTLASPLSSITGSGAVTPSITGGHLYDIIDNGSSIDTVFNFSSGVYSFGGDWDFSPGGAGTGIAFTTANGTTTNIGELLNSGGTAFTGFWGFVSTDAFTSVGLSEGSNPLGIQETYYLDNLTFSTVPEPGTLALMGVGILGFAFASRRKNSQSRAG